MIIKTFKLNEIGGRKNLEDAIMPPTYKDGDPMLFIVCDGVGGSSFGEVASDLASKAFYEVFSGEFSMLKKQFINLLSKGLDLFQKNVDKYLISNPSAHNTSTTFTLLALGNGIAYIAWCGDSKIFQIRNGKPIYESKDHSLIAELVSRNEITVEEAETHPQRNIITRSLNRNTLANDIDYKIIEIVQKDDWFLLCTDGLMEQFKKNQFPIVFVNSINSTIDYSTSIDKICSGKTKDNYSMYLIKVLETDTTSKKRWLTRPMALIILLAVTAGYFFYNFTGKKNHVDQPETFKNSTNSNFPANEASRFKTTVKEKDASDILPKSISNKLIPKNRNRKRKKQI